MRNILMITPYLPYPPISGGRSRTYNLIKRLNREFQFTLVCFGRPEEQSFDMKPLRDLCELAVVDRAPSPGKLQAALRSVTSPWPVTMQLYQARAMREAIGHLLRKRLFDAIHVESFYMMQNLPQPLGTPVLLAEPAIEYIAWWRHARVAQPLYQRPAIALEALKMRFFEPRAWRQSTLLGAMSPIDAEIIRRVVPDRPTVLTPNGVDVEYFRPAATPRDADTAIFMGDYKYFPNTDAVVYFMREIMPRVRAVRPNFTLVLLGKDPSPEILSFTRDPNSGLRVVGLVDDTRPYLNRAAVFVCPLRSGSGTRFKLMEALACGLPVVTTSLGCEGLEPVHDRHMLIADTPTTFAESVLRLLTSGDDAARIARHGRNWVIERHSWARSAGLLSDAYDNLIGSEDLTIPSPASRRGRRTPPYR